MRFTIDLSGPLLNAKGEPMTVSPTDQSLMTLAATLHSGLSNTQSESPVKVWTWCMDLTKSETISIDIADKKLLMDIVQKFAIVDFAKAQLLIQIENAKEIV